MRGVPLGGRPVVILKDPQRRPWARSLLASLHVGKGDEGCPYALLLEVEFTHWKFSGSSPSTLSKFSPKASAWESLSLGLLLVPGSSRCALPFRLTCWHLS